MAHDLSVMPQRRLALFTLNEVFDMGQAAEALVAYCRHPAFDPSFTMLIESSGVTRIDASFLAIVMAVNRVLPQLQMFPKPVKCVVHAPDDIAFGMARMVQQVVEPLSTFEFDITRDETEALSLAGQPETAFAALRSAPAALDRL